MDPADSAEGNEGAPRAPEVPPTPEEIRIVEFSGPRRTRVCSVCGESKEPYVERDVGGTRDYVCRECYKGRRLSRDAFCRSCGADTRPGDRFCGRCGTSAPTRCDGCGAIVSGGDRFCGSCGRQLQRGP